MTHDSVFLTQLLSILAQYPNGLRQSHLAVRLNVHPQKIARTLVELERQGIHLQEDNHGRIALSNLYCKALS